MRLAIIVPLWLFASAACAQTISALPPVSSLTGGEYVPVVQQGTTKRALVNQFANIVVGPNQVLGNATSVPTGAYGLSIPSCSTGTSALIYTTNTAFGCNTFGTVVVQNTGTSGANVPLLSGVNTWSGAQTFGQFGSSTIQSGSSAIGVNANLFNITADTMSVTGANFLNGYTFQQSAGGSALQGGRQTLYSLLQWTAPSNASNANRNYVSGAFGVDVQAGDGGTSPNAGAGAQGAFFAAAPIMRVEAGATNLLEVTGGEVDMQDLAGSSMAYRFGWTVVDEGAVNGTTGDGAIAIGATGGAIGWNTGLTFGLQNGIYPIKSTGTLIYGGPGTVAYGLDTTATTVSGSVVHMASGQKIDLGGGSSLNNTGSTLNGTTALSTVTVSTALSGAGVNSLLASPPAIGGTAAAAGTFTTLTANTSLTSKGAETINLNATAATSPPSGTVLQAIAADGASTSLDVDSYAAAPVLYFRRAQGTQASPLLLGNGTNIARIGVEGYDGSAFSGLQAEMDLITSQAWAVGQHGAKITFNTTPNNSTGEVAALTLGQDQSATVAGGYIASGTKPTLTGTCTTGSQVGGLSAGSFTATCTSQTVIMTFATTAPNGWACEAQDITTTTDTMKQSATSANSCTLTGTTVASDTIVFTAMGY